VSRETIVAAISFTCFGVLVGWILGTQQAASGPVPAAAVSAPSGTAAAGNAPSAPPLDIQRATDLERQANAQPADAAVRAELGNVYYDGGRYDLAAPWYEASLKIDPRNITVSTDLAVCYYNSNQTDKALAQLDHSLSIDPRHAKSLLNQGIIRAFGKSDVKGAIESWEKVVAVAPGTEEAKRAEQALNGIKSAHPGGAVGTAPSGGRSGGLAPRP
jgi:cytochrome c-type biogenesis protein CcmH/NrfG